MTKETQSKRRSFLKGAAATGLAATGVTVFSGSAAAQTQNLQVDSDNLLLSGGLVSVSLQNTNVLNNVSVDISNIDVTVQDISVPISEVVDVGDVTVVLLDLVDVQNVLNENDIDLAALNNVDVQVAVLGANRELSGSETVQVV